MEWSEELAGCLLKAAPDAILILDERRIVQINDRAERLIGRSRDDLLGRDIGDLMSESRQALRRGDGSEIPVEPAESVVDTPRGPLTIAVLRDRTDRSEPVRQEGLRRFAGGIAHDFNNMLGVIVNYANFVIEEAESEAPDVQMIAADARQVIRAGERGTELTHKLLAFAQREVVRPEPLDLNQVIAAVPPPGGEIRLIVRPDPGLPIVNGDRGQLEKVLTNLVTNARDAMPSGGNLVIDTGRHDDGRVRLRVTDSGKGMAPDVLQRVFEPFFTTKTSGGSGLGLATVYGIVAQAGGQVSIASSPGLGTTVTVLLPVGGDPPGLSGDPQSRGAAGEAVHGR